MSLALLAAESRAAAQLLPVTVEAESGALGGDLTNGISGGVQFISAATDRINNGNPGSSSRVATYTVTFPAAGTYHLYARLRVGPAAFDDDSMFFANSFGVKSPTADADWVFVNGLAGVGFNNSSDVVTGGGTVGSGTWKWINLSLFGGHGGVTVAADALTQTFQIGAREHGLDFDKFLFGVSNHTFTVSALDAGNPGTPPPAPAAVIDPTRTFQAIEGLGGAIAFYNGWITAHPYKQEILSNAFAGLNISMLRVGNWFRYQNSFNFDPPTTEIVATAGQLLGRPVPIMMSSWAPPAFLKSNGQVGHGGTLVITNGGFAYNEFGKYWHDSLRAYRSNGISPTWISIQNEPDWEADYDSCIFRPTEGIFNGTNYASYSKALDAAFQWVNTLPSPPKFLAPEPVGIGYNVIQNYAPTLNPNHFYGVAYHLYHGSSDGSANGYINSLRATTNLFPSKPRFMTEFGVSNMVESATLIHNVLTEGMASGYNHWSLIWPGPDGGLVQIEFPWNQAQWTNAPPGTPTQSRGYWLSPSYWAMKHFSYYIPAGSRRIAASSSDSDVKISAYLTPDNLRLVAVLINRSSSDTSTLDLNFGTFPTGDSSVFQTAGANKFLRIGSAGDQVVLPPQSLTTIVLDKFVEVGAAGDPSPSDLESDVSFDATLSWVSGSNALAHLVYVGTSSNAVSQATITSPEFRGMSSTNTFTHALFGGTTYFWRVDEIAGANTNTGVVWSFTTRPLPALVHRYSFDEAGGTTVSNSVAGTGWNGFLPAGGGFSGGGLTLSSGAQQHVTLPAGIVSGLDEFSIATWVWLNSAANWTRIFDFGDNTSRYMFLTPQNGSNGRVRFAITTNGAGSEQQVTGNSGLSTGVWHHVVITLQSNRAVLYVNGSPSGTNNVMTLRPSSLGQTMNNYLGKSQWPDPYFNGAMDEFQIYSVALTASEVAALHVIGPNQLLNSEAPQLSASTGPGMLQLSWPAANAAFSLQSSTNLASGEWTNVTLPVPQLTDGSWRVAVPVPGDGSTYYRVVNDVR